MDVLISRWHCIIPVVAILPAVVFLRGKESDKNKKGEVKTTRKNSW